MVSRTERIMLMCELRENNNVSDLEKLCICQRYCSDENKYIPYKQAECCKNYEWENISVLSG